jgi:biopolymer transport protein ExbB
LTRILLLTVFCAAVNAGAFVHAQAPSGETNPDLSAPNSAAPEVAPSPAAATEAVKKPPLTFFQILFSGGPLGIANMIALILLSIAAVALTIDNALLVRRRSLIPDDLGDSVRQLVAEGQVEQALALCTTEPSFLATVIEHGLAEQALGWTEIEKAMEDATGQQAARLFRRVEYLSVIGNIAPMVGLLGTVTGMLLAFKQVADTEGHAGAAQLADGIYQALVTTVVGLLIAIPALGAFALLRSRVDQLVAEAAYAALHALAPLKQRRAGMPPPVQPPPAPPRGVPPGKIPM